MNLDQIHRIFFLGIGGIGMSALARYFKYYGKDVSGYDLTPTPLTDQLLSESIPIQFDETTKALPDDIDLVIYTPAVPEENKLFGYFIANNIPLMKRSEILGILSGDMFTIAVAGTHGKTSISSIIAHILKSAGLSINALIGGIGINNGSNVILSENPEFMVLEADEYDRSFLTLKPDIAVISSIDADHLDIYRDLDTLTDSFRKFSERVSPDGTLILHEQVKYRLISGSKFTSYGVGPEADFHAVNIKVIDGHFIFDLISDSMKIKGMSLLVPGMHNIENALAAIAVASKLGLDKEQVKFGIESFKGVKRRFEIRYKREVVYIDDYAHHPKELKATIDAARMLYPGKKITGAFQPHLYSRTRDFADDFAAVLSELDVVILLEIYPAREEPIAGVSSQTILDKIKNRRKYLMRKQEFMKYAGNKDYEILLTLGAGDIGLLADDIEKILRSK